MLFAYQNTFSNIVLTSRNNIGNCSIVGKPMCYVDLILCGGHTSESHPILLEPLGHFFCLSSFQGRKKRFETIDHHLCFELLLVICGLGSLGCTQID